MQTYRLAFFLVQVGQSVSYLFLDKYDITYAFTLVCPFLALFNATFIYLSEKMIQLMHFAQQTNLCINSTMLENLIQSIVLVEIICCKGNLTLNAMGLQGQKLQMVTSFTSERINIQLLGLGGVNLAMWKSKGVICCLVKCAG